MSPNQRTLALQARDQNAVGDTITAMGRRHDGLHHWLARVNGIGRHLDSCHCGPTHKDGNLHTVPKRYWLAGIGLALLRTCNPQARRPGQHSYISWHPLSKRILYTGIFSLAYWPSSLDSLPYTDGRADRPSIPDDGALAPGFLQLRAGQLGWTLAASQIRI